MPTSRRRLLGGIALGSAALAGCVKSAPVSGPSDPTAEPTDATTTGSSPTPSPSATSTDPLAAASEDDRGPLRPDGDPVAVERTITDPELDYLPEQDAVRYPAYYKRTGRGPEGQPTRTTIYETTPFADWVVTESTSVGAEKVGSVARAALDGDSNLSVGITKREDEMVIAARQTTTVNREGTVVSEPTTDFERVVAAVPRAVDVTIHFEGQTARRTVPVWVSESTIQYA